LERPGGAAIDELARRLKRDHDRRGLRELLERGRLALEDEVGNVERFAVVERVYDDAFAYWRARYVSTSFGRIYLKGSVPSRTPAIKNQFRLTTGRAQKAVSRS
jgi:hypothetical protein